MADRAYTYTDGMDIAQQLWHSTSAKKAKEGRNPKYGIAEWVASIRPQTAPSQHVRIGSHINLAPDEHGRCARFQCLWTMVA
jgi:hypothetical protein